MAEVEKHVYNAQLRGDSREKMGFHIKDEAVTSSKIANRAVTPNKIHGDVWNQIGKTPTITLGFYTADPDPTPIFMIPARPGHVDELISPRVIINQVDMTDTVASWHWERESGNPALDYAWSQQPRAFIRELHLVTSDLPVGWDVSDTKTTFKITAVLNDGHDDIEITNKIYV